MCHCIFSLKKEINYEINEKILSVIFWTILYKSVHLISRLLRLEINITLLRPFISVKNNFFVWKIIFIVLWPDTRNERLHSHRSAVTESRSRAFVSQESWELPRSFFAVKPRDKRRGTDRHETVRSKRITCAGRDARARRAKRKFAKFLRAARDAFAWKTHASRPHARNSYTKWRNESLPTR